MRRLMIASALSMTFVLTASFLVLFPRPTTANPADIDVGNEFFCSASFQESVCDTPVVPGETVTWTVSAGIHSVTECDDSFSDCPPSGGFDSGLLGSGDTFSQTFNTPGTFPYFCSFHPDTMRGRIVVQAPTPAPTAAPTTAPGGGATTTPSQPSTAGGTLTPGVVPGAGRRQGPWIGLPNPCRPARTRRPIDACGGRKPVGVEAQVIDSTQAK